MFIISVIGFLVNLVLMQAAQPARPREDCNARVRAAGGGQIYKGGM